MDDEIEQEVDFSNRCACMGSIHPNTSPPSKQLEEMERDAKTQEPAPMTGNRVRRPLNTNTISHVDGTPASC